MREAVEEPGPALNLGKQAGDPDPGNEDIKTSAEGDDPVAVLFADRRD
jgi:hypothetical protein